jgi:hypothetical protein
VKVYVASRFERQAELRGYAAELKAMGHTITSRWLTEETAEGDLDKLLVNGRNDMADVKACELLVVFTHEGLARGGMHVEFGMALAWAKRVIVVGPRSTIFHHLPFVMHFDDWAAARAYIETLL